MKLSEFVKETLAQIIQGVADVRDFAKENGALIDYGRRSASSQKELENYYQNVEFDIALTTTDTKEGEAKAGLIVAGLGAGLRGKAEASNQSYSRVKFSIPLCLPTHKLDRLMPKHDDESGINENS